MKKSVDYRGQYAEEMHLLHEDTADSNKFCKPDHRILQLTYDLVKAGQSQFKEIKSEERWNKLENVFYPMFCDIAEICNGYTELDIDEEKLCGTLIYKGRDLYLYSPFYTTLHGFSAAISAADSVYMDVDNEYFVLKLRFNLFFKVRTANRSKEITDIKMKIHKVNLEKYFPETPNVTDKDRK